MADFSHIQSLQTVVGEGVGKAVLQLRVAGSAELLTITCPSLSVAENMADLVDGYCRLVNNSTTSIWNRKGILTLPTVHYTLYGVYTTSVYALQLKFLPRIIILTASFFLFI